MVKLNEESHIIKSQIKASTIKNTEIRNDQNRQSDSSTATVMGMATGYDIEVYEQFVGTLRKTGYKGRIILGVSPDVPPEVLKYFRYRNVTPKILQYVNCTYSVPQDTEEELDMLDEHVKERHTCAHPYSDIKLRWSRFPLARDWLRECLTCTGPVLFMDVRDSYFQQDPFGLGSPLIEGLQVYEEYKTQTTKHWLTSWPIKTCKGLEYDKPMLCSGTTSGTREAMLHYLNAMHEEMKLWIKSRKCWFPINGDDQSIHNYLFYSGQLPYARAIPMLTGDSIVNTVGVLGSDILTQHIQDMNERFGLEQREAIERGYRGSHGNKWCGDNPVCDEDGFFLENDGTRSRVIHQFDRYGLPFIRWMESNPYFKDPMPKNFT